MAVGVAVGKPGVDDGFGVGLDVAVGVGLGVAVGVELGVGVGAAYVTVKVRGAAPMPMLAQQEPHRGNAENNDRGCADDPWPRQEIDGLAKLHSYRPPLDDHPTRAPSAVRCGSSGPAARRPR